MSKRKFAAVEIEYLNNRVRKLHEEVSELQQQLRESEDAARTAQEWLHTRVCELQEERRKSRRLTKELQAARDFLVQEAKRADDLEKELEIFRENQGVLLIETDDEDLLPDWVPSTPPTGITPYYQRSRD